ncbi:glycine--tRNA ligase subunit beta [Calderihabitans maritimus]|uniref:Glycine--tRNA ligase beta subunit n=1 Tax=Calderihabitans maritimus TaxID=1246530 RepID=A0A1Z5HV89_9FIRM|nr:glycine--tRNA ligase subunit beta [Calderihabitans maritimus]GAW93424.1 glycyl-tRNA synthetase, beta subunit [Calderihabitans maritimus]
MARDLLLEVGTEEIPARFMEATLSQLKKITEEKLAEERLVFKEVSTYGTPRRLALYVTGLEEKQEDLVEEVKGPSQRVAFDEEGRPTKAAKGFARSQGVAVEELVVKETRGGAYVYAIKKKEGIPTIQVLPSLLPQLIRGLSFPKPMRWGNGEMRFARPIRWLVALYGEEVVGFSLAGLVADRLTRGHRFLCPEPIVLKQPADYFSELEKGFVIVDQNRRRQMIWEQVQNLAEEIGGRVEPDEELLEEVTYLVEYPTALVGSFAEEYLQLPEEVLITPMREHQRYFPVRDREGRLLNRFITVRNGTSDHLEIVREGNEKVLRARLADAKFFYQEDLKYRLADKVEKLKEIVFQERLGTVWDKVERLKPLTRYLITVLGMDAGLIPAAERAAYLCKADLVTNMVYEFPELQGIMGYYYARHDGEEDRVSMAIREHYLPRFAGDVLPQSPLGMVLSIADRIDSIVGCFAVGIQPTGSQDPYALRRQALGICNIILERGLEFSLHQLIRQAYGLYRDKTELEFSEAEVVEQVGSFFRQRLENILEEKGIRYDVVKAVVSAQWDDLYDAYLRAVAVQEFRQDPGFEELLTAFNRAGNLAGKAEVGSVNPELFEEKVEMELYDAFARVKERGEPLLNGRSYAAALKEIASLREPIDNFFNGVMVMVEDARLRNNRLALLKQITDYILRIADLSQIVA